MADMPGLNRLSLSLGGGIVFQAPEKARDFFERTSFDMVKERVLTCGKRPLAH